MKKYLIQKSVIYKNILYLFLTPVDPGNRLNFLPGQYTTIGFTGRNGRPSPMRCFSIVSTPLSGILEFAIRIQGQFTEALSCLPVGAIVTVEGPFGDFVINPNSGKGVILLAGGIGITPFMSIIRAATEAQSSTPLTLLFSCKNQDDVPFLAELENLEQQNARFKVAFFISDGPIDKLVGLPVYHGRINSEWLGRITGGNYQNYIYYLCGPKGFMVGLTENLTNKGVPPESIFSESFSLISRVCLSGGRSAKSFVYKLTAWSIVAALFMVAFIDLKQTLPKLISSPPSSQITAPSTTRNESRQSTPSYNYSSPSPSQNSTPYRSPRTAVS